MQKKENTRSRIIDALVILFCLAGSFLSGAAFWNEYNRTMTKLNEEPVGTITIIRRTVQRKPLDHVIWDRLKKESSVYNGDTIRTIEVSEAEITFRDLKTRMMLDENTLIQIFYSDKHGESMDFSSGNIMVETKGGQLTITSGSSRIVVDGKANITKKDEGFNISVMEGKVNYNGEEINQGDILALDQAGTRSTAPAIAITSFDISARVLASPGEKAAVNFSWNAVNFTPGTSVIVEVSPDKNFSSIVERSQTSGTSLSLLLEGGNYWWRAFPVDGENEIISGVHPAGTLEVIVSTSPSLLTPAQQAQFFANRSNETVFSWTSSNGASSYLLEISVNRDMSSALVSRSVQGTSIALPGLDAGGYFWRVSPLLPDWITGELPPSRTGSFSIISAPSVPMQTAESAPKSDTATPSANRQRPIVTPSPAVTPPVEAAGTSSEMPPGQKSLELLALDEAVIWQGNGHRYLVVNQLMTWKNADTYAKERGGYLATITGMDEQRFIFDLLWLTGNRIEYWLGGYKTTHWRWVTGETFLFTNWLPSQPDNANYGEDRLIIVRTLPNWAETGRRGQWNDAPNNEHYGCIIEWDAPSEESTNE